jgi:hypothetical protein
MFMDDFQTLSDELILQILSYVVNYVDFVAVGLVCRRFQDLTRDVQTYFWRNIYASKWRIDPFELEFTIDKDIPNNEWKAKLIARLLRERKLKKTKPDGSLESILGELLREKDPAKLQLALLVLQEKLDRRTGDDKQSKELDKFVSLEGHNILVTFLNTHHDKKLEELCLTILHDLSFEDVPVPLGAWTALGSRLDDSHSDEVLNLVSTTLCNYTAMDENREFLDQETLIRTMIELCKKTQILDIKVNTCGILANLGSEEKGRKILICSGGITLFISTLKCDHPILQQQAALGLWNLSHHEEPVKEVIAKEGGIEPLVKLLKSHNVNVLINVVGLLAILSTNIKNRAEIAAAGAISDIINLIKSPAVIESAELLQHCATALWNFSIDDRSQYKIAMVGGVKPLLSMLGTGEQQLKEIASGILYNISANAQAREIMAKEHGKESIKALIQCLVTSHEETQIKINITGTLWNLLLIASYQQLLDEEDGIAPLLELLKSKNIHLQTNVAGALWNAARFAKNQKKIAEYCGIQLLVDLLKDKSIVSIELLKNISGALGNLALTEENRQMIVRLGGVRPLLELLQSPCSELHWHAAAALCNLSMSRVCRLTEY